MGLVFCLASRHTGGGGGIAVVCSAELSPKRGSEILPDGVEEESKG